MIIVEEKTIKVHRGDTGTLIFNIELEDGQFYQFQKDDKVELRIFEKKGYDKKALASQEVIVREISDNVSIPLTSNETDIGLSSNKPITYWYDIYLNGNVTNGYDEEEGPSEFIILPAKGVKTI